MKHWIEQRISRQVLTVFYVLIVLISVPSLGTYFYTQQAIDETMVELERISEQRARATDLFETWQSMQYEMRGHVLLGEASLLDEVRAAQGRIDEQTTWFEQSAASAEEVTFATEARLLFTIYTSRVMPGLERYVIAKANGEVDEPFLQMATIGQLMPQNASSDQTRFKLKPTNAADMSASIVDMESIFTDYRSELDFQETGLRESLSEQLAKAQWSWLIILLGALFTLFISLQPYIVRLTNQLQALITNSERLAVDPHALLVPVDPLQNEVGQLSRSFNAMSSSLIQQHDELEREREKTARIVHTMRDAIVFVKTDTGQRYANAALFDLYEQPIPFDDRQSLYPIEEFYRPFMDQIDDQEGLNRFTNRAKHEGIFDETFTYSMQGGTRIIRMYAEPIELQDERVGVIFVLRDVTKEIEVDRLKTELVATVSHELRTPLTSILGFTELLEHRHVDELKRKRYLGMISSETRRLERLVSDLLDVQKMEAGKIQQAFKVESLFDLLSDVLEVHAGSTELHAFHFECDEEIRVSGDPAQLRQVFSNILNNAIKYSPDGGNIAVNVSCEGDVIRVAIEDEGIGVTAEDAERLFEKFYRVQNEQSRNIGGTGLGLAICKEIIESHGGTISVRSKPEQGTTIIVELPIVE
ncbi:cell wall metabolism sensor histidine kinase WalK [Exiguobacterium sp. SH0S2]|uniref:sensor histidine kinase n=1 Tax=Exiguobacterium sp. SH0S2 TaxID=2510950 RepID=UPI00103F66C9|nr:ATP-binding protein [Exiguobacterium sp. SH0S2]TCI63265.1 histidine kinase [Exiguobacterium sp. SH0S2]